MPIRITGMNSGLDTESIITALTQRHQDRLDTAKNDQKKLTWKQDKWKDLNKKVVSFYNGALSSMRFSTAYSKKITTASNSNAVSVVTGDAAMDSTQTLDITRLAKSAYLTGQEVKAGAEKAKASNTMADLGLKNGGTLKFSIGGDSEDVIEVNVGADESISSVLSKLKGAKSSKTDTSLNFNFDENNGRFFVSSKTAGAAASFDMVETDAMNALGFAKNTEGSNYIAGSSAMIKLNGVEYESESNTFNINGLTITANEVASGITLTTKQDASGIYDNIKKLVKEYSDLMKEFSTLYNADSARKYNMLTDDQKEAMKDDEVEEWEKKIKDGLLSKDETIGSLRDALKSVALKGFEVTLADGTKKSLTLASFGISTGSYFNTSKDERDMLHIDGDPDDSATSGNADLLKPFISSDPNAVTEFFTQLSKEMYTSLTNLMKGSEFSSAYTVYEDKLMASQYSSYNTKIANAQKALEAAQDKYYKKFSVMESTLSKINSNSSSFSSFFGG